MSRIEREKQTVRKMIELYRLPGDWYLPSFEARHSVRAYKEQPLAEKVDFEWL